MNQIIELLRLLFRNIAIFRTINPWEQAIRVRLGRWIHKLGPGIHLRIPYVDTIYVQTVRRRVSVFDRQTITCKDGKAVAFTVSISYEIGDIEKLYQTLHHAEDTIKNIVSSDVAAEIANRTFAECLPLCGLEAAIRARIDIEKYGLSGVQVHIRELVWSRTYRVIGEKNEWISGDRLHTGGVQ